ncbi:MAG: restriction endonuclease subunit S [Calditrichaceae bacterium]
MVEEFKHTELGWIPKEWEVKTLGEVGEVRMCKRVFNRQTNQTEQVPFYKIGTFGKEPDAFIPESLFKNYKKKFAYPKKGDILISASGTIGRTVVFDGKPAYFQDSNIIWLANNDQLISNEFLYHIYQVVKYNTEGGTIQRLYNDVINTTKFICPPTKAEQTTIATALNDADNLIAALEKLIAKKRAIKQGAMQELLRPKEGWEEKELSKTAILKARIGWQGLTTAEYRDSGDYYLITGTEFENGFINWDKCHYVDYERYKQDKNIQIQNRDVLVTKDGTIGKVALIRNRLKPATLNSGVFVIRPIDNSFYPEFFYYLLMSEVFLTFLSQLSAGSTIHHLYQKDFVTFKFMIPNSIDEQRNISRILADMDNEITELEKKLAKYKLLKQGMMQVLLTGKIRLV